MSPHCAFSSQRRPWPRCLARGQPCPETPLTPAACCSAWAGARPNTPGTRGGRVCPSHKWGWGGPNLSPPCSQSPEPGASPPPWCTWLLRAPMGHREPLGCARIVGIRHPQPPAGLGGWRAGNELPDRFGSDGERGTRGGGARAGRRCRAAALPAPLLPFALFFLLRPVHGATSAQNSAPWGVYCSEIQPKAKIGLQIRPASRGGQRLPGSPPAPGAGVRQAEGLCRRLSSGQTGCTGPAATQAGKAPPGKGRPVLVPLPPSQHSPAARPWVLPAWVLPT